MKNNILFSLLISMVAIVVSCSSIGQTEVDKKFSDLTAEAAKVLIEKNKENDQFVIIDTRTPAEYKKAHLNKAVFYHYDRDTYWDQIKTLDKEKIYLVYCHSGGRSGKTVKFMKENGFKEAHNLSGGIVAWKRKGYTTLVGF